MAESYETLSQLLASGEKLSFTQSFFVKFYQAFLYNDRWMLYLNGVATTLLQRIKTKIAELDHWTDKQETKAAVDNLIRDTLWAELPECYDEISISEYRQRIYEYVYTRYRVAA